jgi:RNA polymerase sigma factor (TIGR02999 family)
MPVLRQGLGPDRGRDERAARLPPGLPARRRAGAAHLRLLGMQSDRRPVDDPTPTITTAPLQPHPIDKGLCGPGLLAHVVVSKFADHLPLYRQAGILARHGVDLSASTLGGWVAAAADLLRPLVVRMAELVRQSRVIQTDDTPVPVLAPGSRRTKTGHLWVYLGDADRPYAVFDFTPTYSGDGPRAFLGDYAGYVQADALTQYNALFDRAPPRPTEIGCIAHARRKFHDARASDPARSHEALARSRRLYDIEAEVKPLDDAGRLADRQARARPVLDALFSWLEEQRGQVLPKSPTGVAVGYALGNRAASAGTPRPGSCRSTTKPASGRCGRSPSAARTTCSPGATRAGSRPRSSTRWPAPAGGSGWTRSPTSGTPSPGCRRCRPADPPNSSRTAGWQSGRPQRRDGDAGAAGPPRGMMEPMADVTQLLDAAASGNPKAAADLLPLVYDELRKLAAARMAGEKPGQTIQATALVHEAYLRLVGGNRTQEWNGRGHFFAAAAEAMRRILVEAARRRGRRKRGGDRERIDLDGLALTAPERGDDLLALDEALAQLADADPQAAELVKLRYFAGLTVPQAAAALGVAPRTADFLWAYAKSWLLQRIETDRRG